MNNLRLADASKWKEVVERVNAIAKEAGMTADELLSRRFDVAFYESDLYPDILKDRSLSNFPDSPTPDQCPFESAVCQYFGIDFQDENQQITTDFGQLVNLLAFYEQERAKE